MTETGKIFKESSNVYQDQARILFNFYHQAAEQIVSQEEEIEMNIKDLETTRDEVEALRSDTWKWFLTIVAFFMYWIRNKKYDEMMEDLDEQLEQQKQRLENVFRDYKVTKLGIAYVPVAKQIAYEDKCFMVDYTGKVPMSDVTLQMSRQSELLTEALKQIEKLSEKAPIVESSDEVEPVDTNDYSLSIQEVKQGDYVGKLDRSLRTISYCMGDTEVKNVKLPLILNGCSYQDFLDEYATSEVNGAYVVDVFGMHKYDREIDEFCKINKMKDSLSSETEQFEDVLRHLMHTMAFSVQTISAMKLSSTDKIVNDSNKTLLKLLMAPYNHYSPMLEAEEINRIRNEKFNYEESIQGYEPFQLRQSSRVRYNLFADEWVAEDNSATSVPFGVHQIYEEIVAPMVRNLMGENRLERLKIYGQIHDQKVSYLNKWHQDVDAFYRSNHAESADIINNMQQTLSEYVEAFNTLNQLEKTMESMEATNSIESAKVSGKLKSEESLAAFELQAQQYKQVQDDFADYMDRLQEDIAAKAEEFGHVEFYDARLQDGYSNSMALAASEVMDLDERRKPLAAANPLLAKEAVLLPQPSVENLMYEHLSINLPSMAANALNDINSISSGNDLPPVPEIEKEHAPTQEMNEETVSNHNSDESLPPIPEMNEDMGSNLDSDENLPPIPDDGEIEK